MVEQARAQTEAAPDFRPLYAQVRDLILRRVVQGVWRPGEALPSEQRLAEEFGVSQGTVRKALDAMAAQNQVVREQGRGTFVATHRDQRAQFHFLHVLPDLGGKQMPVSRVLSIRPATANREEARRLGCRLGDAVTRLLRLRTIEGKPVILERIVVPTALMPDFDLPIGRETPEELYAIYERRYGVVVARAEEVLKAVTADRTDARHLGVVFAAPLLQVDRIARNLDGITVEWRLSRCDTRNHHYSSVIE